MGDKNLLGAITKLAQDVPSTRKHLLPVIRAAKAYRPPLKFLQLMRKHMDPVFGTLRPGNSLDDVMRVAVIGVFNVTPPVRGSAALKKVIGKMPTTLSGVSAAVAKALSKAENHMGGYWIGGAGGTASVFLNPEEFNNVQNLFDHNSAKYMKAWEGALAKLNQMLEFYESSGL